MSYSGLSDYVMCQKLDSFLEEDIPNEIKEEIIKVLKDFDRAKSEYLCFEIESLINKPHIDIEEIINLHVFDEIKHEEERVDFPHLLEEGDFKKVKDSFDTFKLDEHDEVIYTSLHEQFINEMKSHNLKLYSVTYKDRPEYDSFRDFMYKNLNIGMPERFEILKPWCFVCFRFHISSLDNKCMYTSWWIVDSPTPLEQMMGEDDADCFNITEFNESIESFCNLFKRNEASWIIDQRYLR